MSSINNNSTGGLPPSELPLPPDDAQPAQPSVATRPTGNANVSDQPLDANVPQPAAGQGLIAEKPRRGFAALATPPPLPPNAPTLDSESLAQYGQLQDDYHQGLQKGAATNQPSVQALAAQLQATDTSTPEGQAKAAKINAQLTHTALNAVATTTSGDTLGAFLLLAVGQQSKSRNAETTLMDISQRGQKMMADQQRAQHAEQAKQMQKAAEKQAKFAFLKPLMAIFTVLLAVVLAPTGPMLGLVLAGTMAGFLAGGLIAGKKKGTGFDMMGALEGASMGAMAGGLGAIFKGVMAGLTTAASKLAPELTKVTSSKLKDIGGNLAKSSAGQAAKSVQTTMSDLYKKAADQAADSAAKAANQAGLKQLAQKLRQNADNAATGAADSAAAGKSAAAGSGTAQQNAAQLQRILGTRKAAPGGANGNAAATLVDDGAKPGMFSRARTFLSDDGKRGKAGTLVSNVGGAIGSVADASTDYAVAVPTNKAKMAEAEAKATQTFLDQYKTLYERAMDGSQALIDARKQSSDMVIDMMRSHSDANKKLIGGFGMG